MSEIDQGDPNHSAGFVRAYDEWQVKYLAKLVTVILLATLSLAPALAAVPCQQGSGCMACCSGMMCPMMAKRMSREMPGRNGTSSLSAPTCQKLPHSSAAVTERQANDGANAALQPVAGSDVIPAPRMHSLREAALGRSQRCGPRTQAVLSTFLI